MKSTKEMQDIIIKDKLSCITDRKENIENKLQKKIQYDRLVMLRVSMLLCCFQTVGSCVTDGTLALWASVKCW